MVIKYRRIWIAEQPIIKQYCQMHSQNRFRNKLVGYVADHFIRWAEHGVVENYVSEESIKKMEKDGEKLLNNEYAERMLNESTKTIHDWWQAAQEIRHKCVSNCSEDELIPCSRLFEESLFNVFGYFMVSFQTSTPPVEERIISLLHPTYKEKSHEHLIALTSPTEADLLFKEKSSFLSLLHNKNDVAIKEHALRFPFLFCNIESEEDVLAIIKNKLEEEIKEDIANELMRTEQKYAELKEKQEKILTELSSTELRNLSLLMQKLALLRLELKNCWSGMHFYLLPFFKKLAEKARANVKDIMMFYTTEDIIRLAETGEAVPKEELKARKECYVFTYDHGNISFYSGDKAKAVKQNYLDQWSSQEHITHFAGTVANKGKVIGKARIIKVDDLRELIKIAPTLTKENIIVTGMTNPNMMILIKKVGGIITDEGGLACHASIVSREFDIPCVVGCSIATQVLHDGDEVELDANSGKVTILKRAAQ